LVSNRIREEKKKKLKNRECGSSLKSTCVRLKTQRWPLNKSHWNSSRLNGL
jgi:hypothetical protein